MYKRAATTPESTRVRLNTNRALQQWLRLLCILFMTPEEYELIVERGHWAITVTDKIDISVSQTYALALVKIIWQVLD